MTVAHDAHSHAAGAVEVLLPLAALTTVTTVYLILAWRRAREPRGWNSWRTICFLGGMTMLAIALLPQVSPFPAGDFRTHMHQHLLIGMYAPIGLVLGAPITLVLRSVPARGGRAIGRALRSRQSHLLAHPLTALVLSLGGLIALYFTPLYGMTTTNAVLHHAVHVHFLVAGYLFAWVIAGPDPAPRRPSVPFRLVILGVAIAGHAVISQLMYAGAFVQIAVPPQQLRGAGELMYYGGDVAELLIALALVTTWRHRRRSPRLAGATASASVRTADRQTDGGDHRPVADSSLIPRASGEVETGAARGG